ncbi:MAG TPA: hypothetical protein VJ011_04930 [Steroidobacteraceae bacterium]|nr:hypothetical protein [Steroidobacteraceae bacterium]
MTDRDLRAIYQYTRSLGPGGEAALAYLPPGVQPKLPVAELKFPARGE